MLGFVLSSSGRMADPNHFFYRDHHPCPLLLLLLVLFVSPILHSCVGIARNAIDSYHLKYAIYTPMETQQRSFHKDLQAVINRWRVVRAAQVLYPKHSTSHSEEQTGTW